LRIFFYKIRKFIQKPLKTAWLSTAQNDIKKTPCWQTVVFVTAKVHNMPEKM